MSDWDAQRIREAIRAGRYEEALGIEPGADSRTLIRAHMKMLAKFRAVPELREQINRARQQLDRETLLERGRRLAGIGRAEQALEILQDGLSKTPEARADDFVLVGRLLLELWRAEDAVEYMDVAVRRRGHASDLLWLGTALERVGRKDEALNLYAEAVRRRGLAEDHLALGSVLVDLGRFREARPYLERAVVLGDQDRAFVLLQRCRGVAMLFRCFSALRRLGEPAGVRTGFVLGVAILVILVILGWLRV